MMEKFHWLFITKLNNKKEEGGNGKGRNQEEEKERYAYI